MLKETLICLLHDLLFRKRPSQILDCLVSIDLWLSWYCWIISIQLIYTSILLSFNYGNNNLINFFVSLNYLKLLEPYSHITIILLNILQSPMARPIILFSSIVSLTILFSLLSPSFCLESYSYNSDS